MKFLHVLVFLIIFSVFGVLVKSSISTVRKMGEYLSTVRIREEGNEFIYESFRNTCKGKGFASLNDWQKCCRAMWNLDYIAWTDAGEFLDVEKGILFYGKWTGKLGSGEVYCRR